jgi:hypothetical protein
MAPVEALDSLVEIRPAILPTPKLPTPYGSPLETSPMTTTPQRCLPMHVLILRAPSTPSRPESRRYGYARLRYQV